MIKEEVDAAITALENWGRTLDSWTLLCAVAIAVFLALGVVLGIAHWINERHLRPLRIEQARFHDLQVSRLQRDAADANARALEAQAELEKFRAPRRFVPPEQHARIVEKLRQFAGQQFFGLLAERAADAWPLWEQIAGLLQQADWELVNPTKTPFGGPSVGTAGITRSGVGILYPVPGPISSAGLQTNAQTLADALNEAGIFAFARTYEGQPAEAAPDAIRIEIGPKP
jgi:hypothetical protein